MSKNIFFLIGLIGCTNVVENEKKDYRKTKREGINPIEPTKKCTKDDDSHGAKVAVEDKTSYGGTSDYKELVVWDDVAKNLDKSEPILSSATSNVGMLECWILLCFCSHLDHKARKETKKSNE
jgi:hypothetical protein